MKKLIILLSAFCLLLSTAIAYNSDELDSAISWMYDHGFTSVQNADDFLATRFIKREEAAKYFVQFATDILNQEADTSLNRCKFFSDINSSDAALKDYVIQACQLGIFK